MKFHNMKQKKGVEKLKLNKLKGYLLEKGYTYEMCASLLNISKATFNQKMNGKRKFYLEEVNTLANAIGMEKETRIDIFLD